MVARRSSTERGAVAEGRDDLAANRRAARVLEELAALLEEQNADRFRVLAYRRAADVVAGLERPIASILADSGVAGLERLPAIGPVIARGLRDLVATGRHPLLERLRHDRDPVQALSGLPYIGPATAERLHHDLGIDSLEDLELALHDGRLERDRWLGPKRRAALRDVLSARLRRGGAPRALAPDRLPSVGEILDVDREYRLGARRGTLPRIAPRRFNPEGIAWLPILHTRRGGRDYTALFSNTARAHQLGRTRDWVVIYFDGADRERQATVVTARGGALRGRRVVRGREPECLRHYGVALEPDETVIWFEGDQPEERGSATERATRLPEG
jgi:hypothetical protein